MKSPDGGGKNPGIQKQPMKPQQKPARPVQQKPERPVNQKPAYTPSPKQEYREAQKPARKPEMKQDRKPERDSDDRKRIAMLDRLKNRQRAVPQDQPVAAGDTAAPASTGGRRRSCCLGCTVYALAAPLIAGLALLALLP